MMKFIKKHPVCTVFLLMPFILYVYYLTYIRYKPDRADKRWYPINLAEKFTKTIDYQTKKHVKYYKCFVLIVETKGFKEKGCVLTIR